MPYSNDVERLERMLPYLAPVAQGKNAQWKITAGSPNTVAYRIREALHIARLNPNSYPDLAKYANDYSISIVEGNTVRARRRTPQISPPSPVDNSESLSDLVDRVEIDGNLLRKEPNVEPRAFDAPVQSMNSESTDGQQTPDSIISMWNKHQGIKRTLYFPEAELSEKQLAELFLWAESQTLMILVHEIAVTLAKKDPHLMDISYKPSQEFLKEEFGL